MNINPISFKGVTRIVGKRALASAERISDIIRHNEKGNTQAEEKIAKRFNSEQTSQATAISFNQGRTAYVVTGDEYMQLKKLYDDMAMQVEVASDAYGYGSEMTKLVIDSEMERYLDLAKMIVLDREGSSLMVKYDDTSNNIISLDYTL